MKQQSSKKAAVQEKIEQESERREREQKKREQQQAQRILQERQSALAFEEMQRMDYEQGLYLRRR